jgi:hypothetical protein
VTGVEILEGVLAILICLVALPAFIRHLMDAKR